MSDKQKRFETVVRTLLEMTVANGCTEAEALAAAEKARDLIDRYQLDIGPEDVRAEGLIKHRWDGLNTYQSAFIEWANLAIGRYCDVRTFRISGGFRKRRVAAAVGLASDMEFYGWLVTSLMNHTLAGSEAYIIAEKPRRQGGLVYAMKLDFIKGCASRISVRLEEMTAARKKAVDSGSRALVPLDKLAIIQRDLDEAGFSPKRGKQIQRRVNDAALAGQQHGDKATFGRPLGSGNSGLISEEK